ncbi:Electron transport complex protein RnfD [Candidatus Izimaplasma bacterium HR1]|jgi:electron transport complex protein RnfD|uniref:RnfABCDGE type electron transport complex subunit D n=1 Tax=Candidatus Izimoplasma sp. HR1 TaxID=1541959 RepID=UPI0004F75AAF|nr:Electron transport complex protein RnfD [Candidatus Izimaplasma bacterium HR1]
MEFTTKKPPIKTNQERSYKKLLTLHISLIIVSLGAIFTRAFIPLLEEGAQWAPDELFKSFLMLAVGVGVSVLLELLYALTEGKAQEFTKYKRLVDPINTGLLIALLLPTVTPIYVLVLAVVVGVYAGKIVFGGYGYYIFNPVLVGVLFANISFASQMIVEGTPLLMLKDALAGGASNFNLANLLVGNYEAVAIGSTAAVLLIILFIYLLINKVVDLRSSGVFVLSVILISLGIGFVNFDLNGMLVYTLVNLLTGLTLFGAVFLISETISSPTSRETKIIYAVVIAILTMAVRVLGTNPEGIVFAVLFGNMITPFLNRTVKRSNKSTFIKTVVISLFVVILTGLVLGFILQGRFIELFNATALMGGLF